MTEPADTRSRAPDGPAVEQPRTAIERLADALEGVETHTRGASTEYARAGRVFARWEGGRHSFRLKPEIVRAGVHTDGAAASEQGPDWIELDTTVADEFTLDRAKAWFELAWRLAGER